MMRTLVVLVLSAAVAAGCSGGGGEKKNKPPIAVLADAEVHMYAGDLVTLDGSASQDPDDPEGVLTFAWALTSLPASSDAFVSPDESLGYIELDAVGQFDGTLVVTDGDATESEPATFLLSAIFRPAFEIELQGLRPGESASVVATGDETHWDVTTIGTPSANFAIDAVNASSPILATFTATAGSSTAQTPSFMQLVTPGAGPDGIDEVVDAVLWTCPEIGQPLVAFETDEIGDAWQFACGQHEFALTGSLSEGDEDVITFVANSSGDFAISFDWTGGTDYDLIVLNGTGDTVIGAPGPFGCGDCCSEAKPEVCVAPLEAGLAYLILVQHFEGPSGTYDVAVSAQ